MNKKFFLTAQCTLALCPAFALGGDLGILNTFRLSSALDLNLDARGSLANDRFDGERGGRRGEGVLSATVGLTYKFKPRGWNRNRTIVAYDEAALNEMREKVNQMSAENARLQKLLAEGKKAEAETIVKQMATAAPNLIIFPIGKSKLSDDSRVNLGFFAEIIKSGDASTVYSITGYADASTGNKEINERLNKERAQAVYDCLVNEHKVPARQLRIDAKGGVENMFYNDPRLSRAVITRSE